MSKRLYVEGHADHATVCRALGLNDQGGLGSLGLAMIMAGSAPGSFTVVEAKSVWRDA